MKAEEFRRIALGLPGTVEGAHMGHADFRVGGKIFASLGPDEDWAMVKLTPEGQAARVRERPGVFEPFAGAWGRQGSTRIVLARVRATTARQALVEAWRNVAPRRLVEEHGEELD